MKQIIITSFLFVILLTAGASDLYGQEKIIAVVEFGRPCGKGRGLCSIKELVDSTILGMDVPNYIYFDGFNRVNLSIQKSSLSRDIEAAEFKNRDLYLVEEDFHLLKGRNSEDPLIISRGSHPIIEMEECYIISFTIKDDR